MFAPNHRLPYDCLCFFLILHLFLYQNILTVIVATDSIQSTIQPLRKFISSWYNIENTFRDAFIVLPGFNPIHVNNVATTKRKWKNLDEWPKIERARESKRAKTDQPIKLNVERKYLMHVKKFSAVRVSPIHIRWLTLAFDHTSTGFREEKKWKRNESKMLAHSFREIELKTIAIFNNFTMSGAFRYCRAYTTQFSEYFSVLRFAFRGHMHASTINMSNLFSTKSR